MFSVQLTIDHYPKIPESLFKIGMVPRFEPVVGSKTDQRLDSRAFFCLVNFPVHFWKTVNTHDSSANTKIAQIKYRKV